MPRESSPTQLTSPTPLFFSFHLHSFIQFLSPVLFCSPPPHLPLRFGPAPQPVAYSRQPVRVQGTVFRPLSNRLDRTVSFPLDLAPASRRLRFFFFHPARCAATKSINGRLPNWNGRYYLLLSNRNNNSALALWWSHSVFPGFFPSS